jgi:hypothetical protein
MNRRERYVATTLSDVFARRRTHRLSAAAMVLLLGCFRPRSESSRFPATAAAHEMGIFAYDIIHADPRNVDVLLDGRTSGRLRVEVRSAVVTQRFEEPDRPSFILQTSPNEIEARVAATTRVLAKKAASGWKIVAPPAAADTLKIATILAADVDLAVQGASMIWDGGQYAFCTWECVKAGACARKDSFEQCAAHVVICAACLEQEP